MLQTTKKKKRKSKISKQQSHTGCVWKSKHTAHIIILNLNRDGMEIKITKLNCILINCLFKIIEWVYLLNL